MNASRMFKKQNKAYSTILKFITTDGEGILQIIINHLYVSKKSGYNIKKRLNLLSVILG